ncbi:hypothetical protein V5O48_000153 [Marasmius crinis-equi]|uniref:Uncharacterized protein n=1 Tax=Marasmius crinis-equi TaxID=585013 RepID=A0ABR3G250_9AGAR
MNSRNELRSADTSEKPHGRFFFSYSQPIVFESDVANDAQVEDELFRLPRVFLPHSERLVDLYPALGDESVTDAITVRMDGCRKVQFESFLTVILEPIRHLFPANHPASAESLDFGVLMDAFDIAKQWGFDDMTQSLQHRASNKFTNPVERITFGNKYHVTSWFRCGLEELVASDEDITIEDARAIGLVLALRVYHARSRFSKERLRSAADNEDPAAVISEVVEEMFMNVGHCWSEEPDTATAPSSDVPVANAGLQRESSLTSEAESGMDDSRTVGSVISLDDLSSLVEEEVIEDAHGIGAASAVPLDPALAGRSSEFLYRWAARVDAEVQQLAEAIVCSTPRSTAGILAGVPKVCHSHSRDCGNTIRCQTCCTDKWKTLRATSKIQARTAFGQMFLDNIIELANGQAMKLDEIVKNVEKRCTKGSKKCGLSKRCAICCREVFGALLRDGEIF